MPSSIARLAIDVVVSRARNDDQVLLGALEALVSRDDGPNVEQLFLALQDASRPWLPPHINRRALFLQHAQILLAIFASEEASKLRL